MPDSLGLLLFEQGQLFIEYWANGYRSEGMSHTSSPSHIIPLLESLPTLTFGNGRSLMCHKTHR